jgi:hypothetical protein
LNLGGGGGGKECQIYDADRTHPHTLTNTERLRVFRAYYHEIISEEIPSMRPRNLFYTNKIVHWMCATEFPDGPDWNIIYTRRASGRALAKMYQDYYDYSAPSLQGPRNFDQPVVLFAIWDHW